MVFTIEKEYFKENEGKAHFSLVVDMYTFKRQKRIKVILYLKITFKVAEREAFP